MIKRFFVALTLLALPSLSLAEAPNAIKRPTFQTFGSQTITEFKADGGVNLGYIDKNGNISVFRSDGSALIGEIDRRGNVTTFEVEGWGDRKRD